MVEGTNFNRKGDDLVAQAEKKLKGRKYMSKYN